MFSRSGLRLWQIRTVNYFTQFSLLIISQKFVDKRYGKLLSVEHFTARCRVLHGFQKLTVSFYARDVGDFSAYGFFLLECIHRVLL